MKKIITLIAVGLLISLSGCTTTNQNVGPVALQVGVQTTAGYSLLKWPEARPGVRAGADVICAASHGTNVSPASIVAAVDAYNGKLTPEAMLILAGGINLYTLAFSGLHNPDAQASPYALALCDGFNGALAITTLSSPRGLQTWPQINYWRK